MAKGGRVAEKTEAGRIGGGVARVVDNPARHNAMSLATWQELDDLLAAHAGDPSVRVLVVAGAGGKAFVSGADVSKFEKERAPAEAVARYDAPTGRVFERLAFPKPTIARIDGYRLGGGPALAVACDLRFRGEGARFAPPAARLGLGYAPSGVRRLIDLVGPAFASEIVYTARSFDAREARETGLVNRGLPDGDVAAAEAAAERVAANAPLTLAAFKAASAEFAKPAGDRRLGRAEALARARFASRDHAEGRRAFLKKTPPAPPRFRG